MNEYIFRILDHAGELQYVFIRADKLHQARRLFRAKAKSFPVGWGLLGVFRNISLW